MLVNTKKLYIASLRGVIQINSDTIVHDHMKYVLVAPKGGRFLDLKSGVLYDNVLDNESVGIYPPFSKSFNVEVNNSEQYLPVEDAVKLFDDRIKRSK